MPSKGANTPRLPLLKKNNTPNTTAMIITVLITLDNFPGSLFTKALIKKQTDAAPKTKKTKNLIIKNQI